MSVTDQASASQERLSLSDLPDVANVREMALFLGVSEWSVREQVNRNTIPHRRIGDKIVFLKPAILRHLGATDADLSGAAPGAGFEPARIYLLSSYGPGKDEFKGRARIEGGFVRLLQSENSAPVGVVAISFPAHSVSWIEWLTDERML